MDERRLRRLLDAGRSLISELDREVVLQRLLEAARDVTGARYAAIGVLDERREGLERFLTAGIDAETHRQIGDLPGGRGVLGVLISHPEPLRLHDVGAHPRSYGFPLAHPPMTTFLGVPILIEGESWGNLYLTEKDEGDFTAGDEEAAMILAGWAAIAIVNARLYRSVRERRDELERTIRGLETMTEISRALGGMTDLDRVLELIAKRSRALLDARAAEIALRVGNEYVVSAAAGEPVDVPRQYGAIPEPGELLPYSALVTPMVFGNRSVGFLMVLERERAFSDDDERLLEAFAAAAATAVATAQTAGDQALRRSLEASEAERTRWARELHDETLQQLAGLRVLLSGARRNPERLDAALGDAIELLSTGIEDLRALIADLRPAALDELGVQAALESLVARVAGSHDLAIELEVELHDRLVTEIESTTYRLVQEGLTNVVKHAGARRVLVRVTEHDGIVEILLRDDGQGFAAHERTSGFGLVGMRERVALVRGALAAESAPGEGTTLRAKLPALHRVPTPAPR